MARRAPRVFPWHSADKPVRTSRRSCQSGDQAQWEPQAAKAALEGERKQVTVLFADLKGSMELLADRDPEDARKDDVPRDGHGVLVGEGGGGDEGVPLVHCLQCQQDKPAAAQFCNGCEILLGALPRTSTGVH